MYDETEETYCSSEHIVSEKTGRLQALVWYGEHVSLRYCTHADEVTRSIWQGRLYACYSLRPGALLRG